MKKAGKIEICLAGNSGYYAGVLVTACSAAINANKDYDLSFNILDGGFSEEQFHNLTTELMRIRDGIEVHRFKINESLFSQFPSWRGNKMAYARFLIASLRNDIDHIIYCDADYLWIGDISELWSLRDDSTILQACRDPYVAKTSEPEWFQSHGYEFESDRYFCTGLLLMNLRLFRNERIVESVYEFLGKHPDVLFPDQGALNILLAHRVKIIEDKWMRFSTDIKGLGVERADVAGIHYVNDLPWKNKPLAELVCDTCLLWYSYYAIALKRSLLSSLHKYVGMPRALLVLAMGAFMRVPGLRDIIFILAKLVGRGSVADMLKLESRSFEYIRLLVTLRKDLI